MIQFIYILYVFIYILFLIFVKHFEVLLQIWSSRNKKHYYYYYVKGWKEDESL